MSKTFRTVSIDPMPAGRDTCNARRLNRDAYCKAPGVANFARCPTHGGAADKTAIDIFRATVPIEKAKQLEALLNDTLSMDNELASTKNMLVEELDMYNRACYYLKHYQETIPKRPAPDDPDFENEFKSFKVAVDLHIDILERTEKLKKSSFNNAQKLIKLLTDGVAKNQKIKEGNKFQLDVKQVSKILRVQLEAHQECKGCPNLKKVVKYMQEHTKDIPLSPNISKQNKEAVGRRAYQEMMQEVNDRAGNIEDAEFTVED